MHIHIDDIDGSEVAPGIVERVLLREDQTIPGGLEVTHHTLAQGEIVFDEQQAEYQHFVVSGCVTMRGRLLHAETALFVPGNSRFGECHTHPLRHAGEGEARLVTARYRTSRANVRWAKTRSRNLYEAPVKMAHFAFQQLITEEEHAVMGALRMHGFDVQTHPPGIAYPAHRNAEEILYVLRGTGVVVSGSQTCAVRPGSLVYTKEGDPHGIENASADQLLQYFVLEFIEHDRMWTERGHQEPRTAGTDGVGT